MNDPDVSCDADEIDRQMRAALKYAVARSGSVPVVVVAVVTAWAVLVEPSLPLLSFGAAFVVMSALSLDVLVHVPRPAPRIHAEGITLRNSRVFGTTFALVGLLVTLAIVALLADPDVFDQGRAARLPLAIALGVVVVVASGALVWRPGQLRVTPEGIGRQRLLERRAWIAWIDVEAVGVPAEADRLALSNLPLTVQGPEELVTVGTVALRPTVWVLIEWLEHYRNHPGDRHELAGQAALDRLAAIEARLSTGRLWPRWFAPPGSGV